MERDAFGRPLQPQPLSIPSSEQPLVLPQQEQITQTRPATDLNQPVGDPAAYASTSASEQPALIPPDLDLWMMGTRVRLQLPDRSPLELQVTELNDSFGHFQVELANPTERYRLTRIGLEFLQLEQLRPEGELSYGGFTGAQAAEAIRNAEPPQVQVQFGEQTVIARPLPDGSLELIPDQPQSPILTSEAGGWFVQLLDWCLVRARGEWQAQKDVLPPPPETPILEWGFEPLSPRSRAIRYRKWSLWD